MKISIVSKYDKFLRENAGNYTTSELSQKLRINRSTIERYLRCKNIMCKRVSPRFKDKNGLTKQEFNILKLLSLGLSDKQIADKLFISIHTLRTHKDKIFGKANLCGTDKGSIRLRAALWYFKEYTNNIIENQASLV